jgi:hypothetical protein
MINDVRVAVTPRPEIRPASNSRLSTCPSIFDPKATLFNDHRVGISDVGEGMLIPTVVIPIKVGLRGKKSEE